MSRIFVVLAVLIVAGSAAASSLLVLPDGSGPYPDIQTAVTAAADGDTVLLGDGVFVGEGNRNLVIADRTLTFRSQAGDPAVCAVDLEGLMFQDHRFLRCSGASGDLVAVVGVEFRNGSAYGSGACIQAQGVALELRDCTFRNALAAWYEVQGGAVTVLGGSLLASGCTFSGNQCNALQGGVGGAIATQDAVVVIVNSQFSGNVADATFDSGAYGGAIAISGGTATIEHSDFVGNRITYTNMGMNFGGAVAGYQATVNLRGCVFADNEGEGAAAGGALAVYEGQGAATSCTFVHNGASSWGYPDQGGTVFVRVGGLSLTACILTDAWGRDGEGGDPLPANAAAAYLGAITATDCDVWGNGENWTGPLAGQDGHDGNFSANPCFCDATVGDYHLCADSWCAAENNVAHPGVLVGALAVGCVACDCGDGPVAVTEVAPIGLRLLGAAPNPFNPATVIHFTLPAPGLVRLTVLDIAGRRLATLVDGACAAGGQSVTWRGRDDTGRAVAGGTYLLRLESGGVVATDKLTLLK